MLYSCFDAEQGDYRVYQDASGHPINGDLPVPQLGSDAGKLGVPAARAGRTLPMSAKYVGRSWNARGQLVQCSGALSGFEDSLEQTFGVPVKYLALGAGVLAGYAACRWRKK